LSGQTETDQISNKLSENLDRASKMSNQNNSIGLVEVHFNSLSKSIQLILLTVGMFIFFGTHNILQEAIMKLPDFNYGVMLGYMEVVG